MSSSPPAATRHAPQPARTPRSTPRINSSELLHGGRIIEIDHAGQRYTLRLTRENKLILTK